MCCRWLSGCGCAELVELSSAGNSESSHDVRLDNSNVNGPWPADAEVAQEELEEDEEEKEGGVVDETALVGGDLGDEHDERDEAEDGREERSDGEEDEEESVDEVDGDRV